jgi:hypothetical protein
MLFVVCFFVSSSKSFVVI